MFTSEDIEALKRHDATAQHKLIRLYNAKIYNLVYYHLQNREESEEVTQDVFLKVVDKIANFESRSKFDTWIYRIAVNVSLDRIRYNQRQKRKVEKLPLHELVKAPGSSSPNPERQMQSQENQKLIMDAIEKLNERQKTALILSKIEGKKQKEIAEIMDLTAKAVESLIQRAKAALKEHLAEFFKEREGFI